MPQPCTVCHHPEREAIDRALLNGATPGAVADEYHLAESSVRRHRDAHLPETLARSPAVRAELERTIAAAADARHDLEAIDLHGELRRCFLRVNLLFDACDAWLRDPDDPSRYSVELRSEDVDVIYRERDGDTWRRKRAKLSRLLAMLEGETIDVTRGETRIADIRELVLKSAGQLTRQVELLAKVLGQIGDGAGGSSADAVRTVAAIFAALEPYPDAKRAVAAALRDLDHGARP